MHWEKQKKNNIKKERKIKEKEKEKEKKRKRANKRGQNTPKWVVKAMHMSCTWN